MILKVATEPSSRQSAFFFPPRHHRTFSPTETLKPVNWLQMDSNGGLTLSAVRACEWLRWMGYPLSQRYSCPYCPSARCNAHAIARSGNEGWRFKVKTIYNLKGRAKTKPPYFQWSNNNFCICSRDKKMLWAHPTVLIWRFIKRPGICRALTRGGLSNVNSAHEFLLG